MLLWVLEWCFASGGLGAGVGLGRASELQASTNSMEQSPSWESNNSTCNQEFMHALWTRMFITASTTALHLFITWSCESIPHPPSVFFRSVMTLSFHLFDVGFTIRISICSWFFKVASLLTGFQPIAVYLLKYLNLRPYFYQA